MVPVPPKPGRAPVGRQAIAVIPPDTSRWSPAGHNVQWTLPHEITDEAALPMRVGKHELAGRGLNLVAKVVALGWWHVQWVAQDLRDRVYLVRSLVDGRIGADGPYRTAVTAVATAHREHL